MNFTNYSPTFRNVLLREVRVLRTRGGVILPSTEYLTTENEKSYVVLKVGEDCTTIKPGYIVKVGKTIYLESFSLHDIPESEMRWQEGEEIETSPKVLVYQVMEQQIIGYVTE